MLRKPMPGEMYGPVYPDFNDKAFTGDYPTLHEYLFTTRWADGSVRATSTLSIFTDGASMRIVLNDRDNNRSAFFSATTFVGALEAMEAALSKNTVEWKSKGGSSVKGMQTPF